MAREEGGGGGGDVISFCAISKFVNSKEDSEVLTKEKHPRNIDREGEGEVEWRVRERGGGLEKEGRKGEIGGGTREREKGEREKEREEK